jgi:hypothetical protein
MSKLKYEASNKQRDDGIDSDEIEQFAKISAIQSLSDW